MQKIRFHANPTLQALGAEGAMGEATGIKPLKMINSVTGHIFVYPPPDCFGKTGIYIDGQKVIGITCYDDPAPHGRIVLDDGRTMTPDEFSAFALELIKRSHA